MPTSCAAIGPDAIGWTLPNTLGCIEPEVDRLPRVREGRHRNALDRDYQHRG